MPGAEVIEPPATVRTQKSTGRGICPFGDGDSKFVATRRGDFIRDGDIPTADEDRCYRRYLRIESRSDAPLDALQVSIGGSQVLFPGEEKGYVDWYSAECCLFN